jgi:hypothetical protein
MDAQLRPNVTTLPHPYTFADRMRSHWTTSREQGGLGNVYSAALGRLWLTMGETFNRAIEGNLANDNPFRDNPQPGKWHVLSPATGSGKTQGVRLYSAMLAKANLDLPSSDKVGVLIVTREIEQADELAQEIRDSFAKMAIGGSTLFNLIRGSTPDTNLPVALARHSNAPEVTLEDMRRTDVLVVCHASYVQALDSLSQNVQDRWSSLMEWEHGQRRLVVVDETISNLVEEYRLELDYLSSTLGDIRQDVKDQFPGQIRLLNSVIHVLQNLRTKAKELKAVDEDVSHSDAAVWNADTQRAPEFAKAWAEASQYADMSGLRAAVKADRGGQNWKSEGSQAQHKARSEMIDSNLKAVQAICSRWAWYARSGKYDTLNASRLVLPEPFPLNVVCLDATAKQEVLWELLGKENVERPEMPEGVRSYGRVTLNVARAGSISKGTMKEYGKARLARLIEHLNKRFDGQSARKVFLVTHKDIEHHANDHLLTFGQLSVAHWGSLDGKNEWADHDVAVLFGLSYRMRIWANNLYQAIKGRQGTDWLQSNNALRNQMEVKQLTASIVQAMNRIRCRKTVDDKGNCDPAEVFIVLKEGNEGDAILEGIRKEMPGIVVTPWDFNIDGPRATIRKGSSHEALVTFMENAPEFGEWPMTWIERELSLSKEGAKSLRAVLADTSSNLSQRLTALGVKYETQGYGKSFRANLVKRSGVTMAIAAE